MHTQNYDFVIVGGGIFGTTLAYWISTQYEGRVAVLEKESDVAMHTSGRNTGVIHRPFYLDPIGRRVFAQSAQISYSLWKQWAERFNLPWKQCGTIEVALMAGQVETLEKYGKWALENGMRGDEVAVLTAGEVQKLEPHIKSHGAIFAKTDTSVDFGMFTHSVYKAAAANGVEFLFNHSVKKVVESKEAATIILKGRRTQIKTKYVVNCAGGNSIDIAHAMGVAMEYTDLHFRGEYLIVAPRYRHFATHNIYSVPRHKEFPFLDPHWIVRPDGQIWLGPTALPVSGPYAYNGLIGNPFAWVAKLCERPVLNKARLLMNREFLQLAKEEWYSVFSKEAFVRRVQQFLPTLEVEHLQGRGLAGIRSSVIDAKGQFVREALTFTTPQSFHIVNYNSPGATGAPAYTAYILNQLEKAGALMHMKKRQKEGLWHYEEVSEKFD